MAALDNIASELLKSANEADLIYKRTRDQAQRDKAVRLRRIVENLRLLVFGASDLNGLNDVTLSALANGQVLTYNSTTNQWENQTPGGGVGSTGYYGAFSDYTNQTAAAINTGYPMILGTTDLNNEVTIQSNSRITFNFAGKYNLQWSAQFVNADTHEHDVNVWLRRNGTDVLGSTGRVSVASSHGGVDGHVLPSWNFVVEANANDYYEFVWSTNSTQVSIVAFPASAFAPSTASIVVTATPVIGNGGGSGGESVGSKLYLFNNI